MKLIIIFLITFSLFACQTAQRKKRADNYHAIGISFLKKCDSKSALGHLKKAVSYQPENSFIRYTLGSAYFLMKEYSLAREQFSKALDFNPRLTEAQVSLALNDIEMGQFNRALKGLKRAEADLAYIKTPNIISYKGYVYFKQKKYAKARKNFKKIYKETKDNTCFNYLHLGKSEFYLKNYREAERVLKNTIFYCENQNERICKREKHLFEEHYFLGEIYKKLNRKRSAQYHFKIFLKRTSPSSPYFLKAKTYIGK